MISIPVSTRPWPLVLVSLIFPFLALLIQLLLWESIRPLAFVLFYPAIVLSSWIGGRLGGTVAIILSVAMAAWFFIAPTGSHFLFATSDILRMISFVIVGIIIVWAHHRFQTRTEQLEIALEKYRNVTENIDDVVWVLDAESLDLRYVSPSVSRQLGYTPEELITLPAETMLPATLVELLRNLPAGQAQGAHPHSQDILMRHKTAGELWTEVIMKHVVNSRTGRQEIHCVSRDISERKKTEDYIRHMAQHDTLTGLPNRALFDEHISTTLAQARRKSEKFGLMFIDLDKFKEINDTLGHRIGDLLLQGVTARLVQAVRSSDIAARIGGDEFVILLREVNSVDDTLLVAEKVRRALHEPFEIEAHVLTISASIGIALYPLHGENPIELSASADAAMYLAKKSGRNKVTVASESTP